MHYRVFFYFAASGAQIASDKAVEMEAEKIAGQLLDRLVSEGDYLGLMDERDRVLQIALEADGRYWVELPMDAARASYGRHMDLAGVRELLAALPERFAREGFPAFEYRPW